MTTPTPSPGTPGSSPSGASGGDASGHIPEEHVLAGSEHGTRPRRGGGSSWVEYLVTMLGALLIAVLIKTFLFQPFYIPSESMNPTLEVDDKIIVSKLTPGVFDLEHGDVVVFEDTENWIQGRATDDPTLRVRVMQVLSIIGLTPDPAQNHLVKRLIGLPGDHVVCEEVGGPLQVNGVTLEEPYINPENPACKYDFDVTVPDGHIWVMGDNRYDSADSAHHHAQGESGFVPLDDVTGKATAVFWPVGRWTGLGDGTDAFDQVPAAP